MEKLALCNDFNTNSFQRYWKVFLVETKSFKFEANESNYFY